jgi:hypothetical protein
MLLKSLQINTYHPYMLCIQNIRLLHRDITLYMSLIHFKGKFLVTKLLNKKIITLI